MNVHLHLAKPQVTGADRAGSGPSRRVCGRPGEHRPSDVVTRGEVPAEIRPSVLLWVGCVAGALEEDEHRSELAAAGFQNVGIEPTRIYRAEDAALFLADCWLPVARTPVKKREMRSGCLRRFFVARLDRRHSARLRANGIGASAARAAASGSPGVPLDSLDSKRCRISDARYHPTAHETPPRKYQTPHQIP